MNIKYKNIGVLGIGGIGGLISALLSNRKYKVFSNKRSRITLDSKYYGFKESKIFLSNSFNNCRLILVCSKFPYLEQHINKIKNNKQIVLPLLNGALHYPILKKKFNNVFVSNIGKVVSYKIKKKIVHTSLCAPEILVSSFNKNKKDIKLIRNLFKKINIKIKFFKNDNYVLFNKLIRIASISLVTSYYNNNLGEIRASKIKFIVLKNILKEIIKIVNLVHNTKFIFSDVFKEIESFPNNLTTSLQRDINLKKKSELETQIGYFYNLATCNNINTPILKKIYLKLKKNCI